MRAARRRALLAGTAAIAIALGLWLWHGRGGQARATTIAPPEPELLAAPERPRTPPPPGMRRERQRVAMPVMPPRDFEELANVAAAARAAGKRPGEAAFRRMIDAFMEHNAHFARAQAAKEGITVAEVAELTYLGYMVKATQSPHELEQVTGRTYSEAEREKLGALMQTHNAGFKEKMRALVKDGAPEEARWELIRATEDAYKRDLFALTGLDDDTFDAILAGDITKPGAPIATEPPEVIEPRPYVETAPRPSR